MLVAGIICALLSIITYQYSASIESDVLQAEVVRAGVEQRLKLQNDISRTVELLDTVGNFVSQTNNLNRESFAVLTRPIIRNHPELWAIHWVPYIRGNDRAAFEQTLAYEGFPDGITALNAADNSVYRAPLGDEYYPILYSEPLERSHVTIGFNTYSRDVNAEVIDALAYSHERYLGTDPFYLFSDLSNVLSLSYYRPVYDEAPLASGRLRGYVLALIQPQVLLENVSSIDSEAMMRLYDVTDGELGEVATTAPSSVETPAISYRSEFSVMGRNWLLEVWNDRLQPEHKQSAAQWVLIFGLLLTLLLVFILFWLAKTHRQILLERDRAQSYLDTVETIMLLLNPQGEIQMINRKGSEVLGINIANLLGKNWFASQMLVDYEEERKSFEALFNRECPISGFYKSESKVRGRDGELRLITWRNRLRFDEAGQVVGVLCAGVDITEQRQSELLDRLRSHAMEATLQGESLSYVLDLLVKGIETQTPGALCSVLLLDDSGQYLSRGAAPSLPDSYFKMIDGLQIGEGVGSCGTAAFRRERVVVEDIETHPFWADFKQVALECNLRSCWSEPIFGRKRRLIGIFSIYHQFVSKPSRADLELTESMSSFISLLVEEFQAEATLKRMANTDELTGLNNRRKLFDDLETEFQRAKRYGRPFSLCMLDLDFFKKINDQYGHDAGDQVLKAVAQAISLSLRENDMCGRIGGEEFTILLPDTALDSAAVFAERLRQHVEALSISLDDGQQVTLTCSIGVAEYSEHFHKATELLSCADQRLYHAKANGRNRISIEAT